MRAAKTFTLLLLIFVSISNIRITVSAQESIAVQNQLNEQIEYIDLSRIDDIIRSKNSGYSISETISRAVSGQLDISPSGILNTFMTAVFGELRLNAELMRDLLLITILSAILRALSENFKNKSVSELGFYVCYAVCVMLLLNSFKLGIDLVIGMTNLLSVLMLASIPIMIGLMFAAGQAGSAAFSPVLYITVNTVTYAVTYVFMPAMLFAAVISVVNYLTEKEILTKFAGLFIKFCKWGMRCMLLMFVSVLALQKISIPIISNLAVKAAKSAIKAIPGVGGLMDGAMDSVIYFAGAIKSGVMVALVITIVVLCGAQLVKLLCFVIIYKLIAALVQPVSDPRIVKCIDSIGNFSAMMLEAGVIVVVMFIYCVMMLLAF